jgi:beta-lactamase class A
VELDDVLAGTRAAGAQWSIAVRRDGQPAPWFEHEARTLLRTASVAKVFLLLELAGRLAARDIDPGHLVDRRRSAAVHDSGLWRALRVDQLPVTDLAVLVGAVSDNWATNALLDLCGLDRVQALAADLAPGGSMLHDYVRDKRSGDLPATLSEGCAGDWATIMQRLHRADGIDATVCRSVLSWLALGTDLSMVAGAFDLDPLAHDTDDLGIRLWHKTGTDPGVRADVGVVRSGTAAVSYAVVCNWPEADAPPGTRRAVLQVMREIGDEIRSALAG